MEVPLKPYKRRLFSKLVEFLDDRQILLIYGLRRVGKPTMSYQLINHLLEKGVERNHILHFSFDEAVALLKSCSPLVSPAQAVEG